MDHRLLISEIASIDVPSNSEDTLISELKGWDSLKGVRLILRLEEFVGRQLLEAEIEGISTIGDVRRFLVEE